MKILITIGMVIVFISALFIFLTGDAIFKTAFECIEEAGKTVCQYMGLSGTQSFGLVIIAFFIVIDFFTVYIILTNVTGSGKL